MSFDKENIPKVMGNEEFGVLVDAMLCLTLMTISHVFVDYKSDIVFDELRKRMAKQGLGAEATEKMISALESAVKGYQDFWKSQA